MKIKIFQIDVDKDKNNLLFTRYNLLEKYQGTKDIDSSIYEEVYSGEVDCDNLEDVFTMFNQPQPLLRGHSMSVSDVVQTDKGFYFCDSTEFIKIPFDVSQVSRPNNLLRAVYVEPNKLAYETEIPDELEFLQRAVSGYIQSVPIGDKMEIICNEEGKLMGMQPNRYVKNLCDIIAGPFLIVGAGRENFKSLTDEQVAKCMEQFGEPNIVTILKVNPPSDTETEVEQDVEADTGTGITPKMS